MKIKNIFKQEKGGTLLITVVILSMMILLLMSAASLKLAEVARHANRANEHLRYVSIMEDLSQAVARAFVLGKGTCTSGTTPQSIGGQNFCIPNARIGTGGTGGGAVTDICVDLDQNNATVNDRYCVEELSIVNNEYFKKETDKMVAKANSPRNRIKTFVNSIFTVPLAYADCQWYGGASCDTTGDDLSPGDTADIESKEILYIPSLYTVAPVGVAVEQTQSAVANPRNNLETWSPNIVSWTPNNEILTPDCVANDNYWLGCVRCTGEFTCVKISLCPPSSPGCPLEERYHQLLSIW